MMDRMDVSHCKRIRESSFLDNRSSKKWVFSPLETGGGGLEMIRVVIHTIFIWFTLILLNSSATLVRKKCRQNMNYFENYREDLSTSLLNTWMSFSSLLEKYKLELKCSNDTYSIISKQGTKPTMDKESLRKLIRDQSIRDLDSAKETFDTDSTFHYDSVDPSSFSYWKNPHLSAKQCKLFFYKLSTGLWNTSYKMGTMNACITCKIHGVQDNKTTLEHVILKCPHLREKVERLHETISNIIRIPYKLCWENEFRDSILCISPRGNFNTRAAILQWESIREIQSVLVEFLGPLKTLSDI